MLPFDRERHLKLAAAQRELALRLDRSACEERLITFLERAWSSFDPSTYVSGWHLNAIAEHLEAVSRGEIRRLLINIPPRFCKTLLVSVAWPAWLWAQKPDPEFPLMGPQVRFLCLSYGDQLATDTATTMRRLVTSEWYQKRWGDRVKMASDTSGKGKFDTTAGGTRISSSFGGATLGRGGDIKICLPYDEVVHTIAGRVPIGKYVKHRMTVPVLSCDSGTGHFHFGHVTDWVTNPGADIYEIGLDDGSTVRCTGDHRVLTRRGWVRADGLVSDDLIPKIDVHPDFLDVSTAHGKTTRKWADSFVGPSNLLNLLASEFMRSWRALVARAQDIAGFLHPSLSTPDLGNDCYAYAELGGNGLGVVGSGGNRPSYLGRQNSAGTIYAHGKRPMLFGVANVLRTRPVGDVFKFVVGAIAVQVTGIMSARPWSNKRRRNGLVREDGDGSAVNAPVASKISVSIWNQRHNSSRDGERYTVRAHRGPWFAANAPVVRDAVKISKSGERKPSFIRKIGFVPETFCLTVHQFHSFVAGGGNGIVVANCDDPHKVDEAESAVTREGVLRTYDEALKSRVTDPKTSAEVIIMQRLHVNDLSGHVLEQGGFVHLCLPAEFDSSRRCTTVLGWEDPREDDGDLLWPERFGRDELDPFRKNPYTWAGQFQQIPVPRGGGILKADWWVDWEDDKHWPVFDYVIASLDTAYTEKKSNDPSALTVWGVYTDANQRRRVMLMDAWREWLEIHKLVEKVAATCKTFKVDRLLIENKAAGHSVGQELERLYGREPWGVDLLDPRSQDKEARVHSVVPMFADGVVVAPLAMEWAQMVVSECSYFPRDKHDDLVDSTVQALRYLRDIGLAELGWEIQAARTDSLKYRSPNASKPLYVA